MQKKKTSEDLGYLALRALDNYIGTMETSPTPGTGKKLQGTIEWIKKCDLGALEALLEQHKGDFLNIKTLSVALSYFDPKAGIFIDFIDKIIFYRERGEEDLEEILRVDKYGNFFHRGSLIMRDFKLYSDVLLAAGP